MTKYESDMDDAREETRKESEALTMEQAESMTEYHPKVVAFLKRPNTRYYGEFRPETEAESVEREMKKRIPKGHIYVGLDNWPDRPRVWFVCSEPHELGASRWGVKETTYPPMEGAA